MRSHVAALSAALLSVLSALPAQREDEPTEVSTNPLVGRKPTKDEVAKQLDQVKTGLLPRVWHPKCDTDAMYRRKYLDQWQAVTSDHYIVFTDGPTATCKKYGDTLEALYATIKKELPFEDLDRLLVAYIFADPEDYYRYSEKITGYSPEAARQTAGHATSQFYATYYSSPRDAVVYHEATHEIVGACLKVAGVGSWFQEGLAVYFEKKMTNDKVEGDTKTDIRRGNWYPLDEFFALSSLLGDQAGHGHRSYEHAGALVDFMINTKLKPVAGKFEEFLKAGRQGHGYAEGKQVSERMIKTVYGLTIAEFEALWLEHLKVKR